MVLWLLVVDIVVDSVFVIDLYGCYCRSSHVKLLGQYMQLILHNNRVLLRMSADNLQFVNHQINVN